MNDNIELPSHLFVLIIIVVKSILKIYKWKIHFITNDIIWLMLSKRSQEIEKKHSWLIPLFSVKAAVDRTEQKAVTRKACWQGRGVRKEKA